MHKPMVMQETTVEATKAPVDLAKPKILCSTTSRQPALLIIPAKQKAQNASSVVPIISAIPPRFSSFKIEGAAAGSKPGRTIIATLKPLTVAAKTLFKVTLWKIRACDNRAGSSGQIYAQSAGNTHQRHAHSSNGAPGGAGYNGYDGSNQESRYQHKGRIDKPECSCRFRP